MISGSQNSPVEQLNRFEIENLVNTLFASLKNCHDGVWVVTIIQNQYHATKKR